MKFIKENFTILLASIVLTISSLIYNSNLFSYITALTGIIAVFLIGKKEWIGYIFTLVNYSMYAYTLYNNGMTISTIYYIIYAIPVNIYGLIYWRKHKEEKKENVLPTEIRILLYTFIILSVIGLIEFKTEKWYYDLLTTLFGSFALILMARKYKEQWISWAFANLIGTFLWTGVFVEGVYDISLFLMWSMYLVNSIYFLLLDYTQTQ